MVRVFKDYYEGEFDMRKNITVTDRDGKTVISPFANPFMKVDELKLHKGKRRLAWLRGRAIAVHFTVYATIIQYRDFLPDGNCWCLLVRPG